MADRSLAGRKIAVLGERQSISAEIKCVGRVELDDYAAVIMAGELHERTSALERGCRDQPERRMRDTCDGHDDRSP